jgi:hypothetical protein
MYGAVQLLNPEVLGSRCVSVSPCSTVYLRIYLSGRSFDSLNAGNGFDRDIEAFLKDKPVLQYAAFN